MQRKSIPSRAFWVILVGGMLTGMGNGSVFGAAVMCSMGRGSFADWGGWWPLNFNPHTFTGVIDGCMLVVGFMFVGILAIALKRHDALENPVES